MSVLVVLATLGNCLPAQAVSDDELIQVSLREMVKQERRCGLVGDAALNARVKRVFDRVVAASPRTRWPLRIRILNNPQPNAFSLPNGQVYLNVGLFSLQPTDDELAFVLAHEIAHVCREHVKTTMSSAEQLGTVNDRRWMSSASRTNESQADLDGASAMASAGYRPQAVITFMRKMGSAMDRYSQRGPAALEDHPRTEERVANVMAMMSQHPDWNVHDYGDNQAYQDPRQERSAYNQRQGQAYNSRRGQGQVYNRRPAPQDPASDDDDEDDGPGAYRGGGFPGGPGGGPGPGAVFIPGPGGYPIPVYIPRSQPFPGYPTPGGGVYQRPNGY